MTILDYNIPKFKLKHQQFKNGNAKILSELAFLLFLNKRIAFLGHPAFFLGHLVYCVQKGSGVELKSSRDLPADFVMEVKQIDSQSDLISMSNLVARLTSQSDPLATSFQFEILVFSIFTISAKLDPITYIGKFTNVYFISMKK